MPDQSASERAYIRLKDDILSGALAAGPLDLRQLGDRFRMSVTPVREALARLSAERLVKLAPHHGYAVASLSGRRVENLYELTGGLIDMAIDRCPHSMLKLATQSSASRPAYHGYVDRMSGLVREIGAAQSNLELREHLLALDERLHPVRRCEPKVFTDCEDELNALVDLWDNLRLADLRAGFRSHFERRTDRADALARQLSAPADDR